MKKVTEDWTALEDEEDSEESYEEVTDNENFSEQEIFELYWHIAVSQRERFNKKGKEQKLVLKRANKS